MTAIRQDGRTTDVERAHAQEHGFRQLWFLEKKIGSNETGTIRT
jgi:hypothetical protein